MKWKETKNIYLGYQLSNLPKNHVATISKVGKYFSWYIDVFQTETKTKPLITIIYEGQNCKTLLLAKTKAENAYKKACKALLILKKEL